MLNSLFFNICLFAGKIYNTSRVNEISTDNPYVPICLQNKSCSNIFSTFIEICQSKIYAKVQDF